MAHHRVTIARFAVSTPDEVEYGPMSLEFPGGSTFKWTLPIAYDRGGS